MNANTDFRCRLQFSLSQLRSEQLTFLNIPWINKSEGCRKITEMQSIKLLYFFMNKKMKEDKQMYDFVMKQRDEENKA